MRRSSKALVALIVALLAVIALAYVWLESEAAKQRARAEGADDSVSAEDQTAD